MPSFVKIHELTEAQEKCLGCPLFKCDLEIKRKECRFVSITVDEHLQQEQEKLRQQKRDHNARVRAMRSAERPELESAFGTLLNQYVSHGKHSRLMKAVRLSKKGTTRQQVMETVREMNAR